MFSQAFWHVSQYHAKRTDSSFAAASSVNQTEWSFLNDTGHTAAGTWSILGLFSIYPTASLLDLII